MTSRTATEEAAPLVDSHSTPAVTHGALWQSRIRRSRGSSNAGLAARVERAREVVAHQDEPVLYAEMTEEEIQDERALHEWMRAKRRAQRRRAFRWELAQELRARKALARSNRRDERERQWHAEALDARRRATSPDSIIGRLYRRMTLMSRNFRIAMVIPFVWSAINVGRNLMPGGPAGVTWWALWIASFLFEAMVSVPILETMRLSTTAAESGHQVERARAIGAALLLVSVLLNVGPQVAQSDWGHAAAYSLAPTMVVVLMWMHSWLAGRYAQLIDGQVSKAGASSDEPDADSVAAPDIQDAPTMVMRAQPSDPATPIGGSMPTSNPATGAAANDFVQDQCQRIARSMIERRRSTIPEQKLVALLRLAEAGENRNAIAARLRESGCNVPRSTVDRVIDKAIAEFGLRVFTAGQGVVARSA